VKNPLADVPKNPNMYKGFDYNVYVITLWLGECFRNHEEHSINRDFVERIDAFDILKPYLAAVEAKGYRTCHVRKILFLCY
jgi:hypothetical protein